MTDIRAWQKKQPSENLPISDGSIFRESYLSYNFLIYPLKEHFSSIHRYKNSF